VVIFEAANRLKYNPLIRLFFDDGFSGKLAQKLGAHKTFVAALC